MWVVGERSWVDELRHYGVLRRQAMSAARAQRDVRHRVLTFGVAVHGLAVRPKDHQTRQAALLRVSQFVPFALAVRFAPRPRIWKFYHVRTSASLNTCFLWASSSNSSSSLKKVTRGT